jgi:hypothetical protein
MALAGVGVGFAATLGIWFAGTAFTNVGLPRKDEFGVSQGAAWFYVATLVVTCCALVVLYVRPVARRIDGGLRAFLLGLFFVVLGGMSLCNFFSSSSLFLKSS